MPANAAGGVDGRRIVVKAYDDQYDPDLAIRNTVKLMDQDNVFALSAAVGGEIAGVLNRPRFARAIPLARRERVLEILRHAAVWFEPTVQVTDCDDPKDNKYLEFSLAAGAEMIVSSDDDLLVLDPWRGVRIMRPAGYLDL